VCIYTYIHIYIRITHTGSSSIVLFSMCCVLSSYACTVIGQGLKVDTYLWPYIVNTPFSWSEILWCAVMCLWQIRVCCGWKQIVEHWSAASLRHVMSSVALEPGRHPVVSALNKTQKVQSIPAYFRVSTSVLCTCALWMFLYETQTTP
jgi:hypothetical protein